MFDTVNQRRSALNIASLGIMWSLYVPLESDGVQTEDDGENALGFYVGYDYSGTLEPVYTNVDGGYTERFTFTY